MVIIDKKKDKGLCVAYRCTRKHSTRDRFCHKHRKRFQKDNNPLVYCYGYLKQNAKRRGKAFSLTIEEFKQFCNETGYLELKGKLRKSASIDRIDHTKGYSLDNIQVLSLSDNGKKGNEEKYADCPF